jgi:hypothetical protein
MLELPLDNQPGRYGRYLALIEQHRAELAAQGWNGPRVRSTRPGISWAGAASPAGGLIVTWDIAIGASGGSLFLTFIRDDRRRQLAVPPSSAETSESHWSKGSTFER